MDATTPNTRGNASYLFTIEEEFKNQNSGAEPETPKPPVRINEWGIQTL